MKYAIVVALLVAAGIPTDAQEQPEKKGQTEVQEIIITASRHETDPFNSPYTTNIIEGNDLRLRKLSRTLPDALREIPSVNVQKTAHGQGSPYLRGFTGFGTLMLVDGIRLNNSVLRFGPNQYWGTVDPLTIGRLEVVKGPASVLYGSDAVGGTVNAITITPSYEDGDKLSEGGKVYLRYATAEHAFVSRAEGSVGVKDIFGVVAGVSRKAYGDLRAGGDMDEQPHTGYDELNGDLKAEIWTSTDAKLIFAHQRVRQDDVPRTHKTIYGKSFHGTIVESERKRDLDQDRDLTYLQYHTGKFAGFADHAKFNISYQNMEESQDRLKATGKGGDHQGFDADTIGFGMQFESRTSVGYLTYGAEYYHDDVDSFKKEFNENGSLKAVKIQGPVADDATYDLIGLYLQDEIPLAPAWDLTLGARYTRASADADKVDIRGALGSIDDDWNNVVGSARLLYRINPAWNAFVGASQGFRAPNLSDLTTLDETSAVEEPSPDLDPEEFVSLEIGLKARHERWEGQAAYWYTIIDDMIVQSPTGAYSGTTAIVRKDNIGDGYAHGIEMEGSYTPWDAWKFFGNFTWMYGAVDQLDEAAGFSTKEAPLSRLMPAQGNLGLRYQPPKAIYWIEGLVTMVDNQEKLALRDRTDRSRIPPNGSAGYTIYTIRSGVDVHRNVTISAALENITDKNYRVHGSGVNESGINAILATELRF